jgi:hypothetical protein
MDGVANYTLGIYDEYDLLYYISTDDLGCTSSESLRSYRALRKVKCHGLVCV